MKTKMFTTAIMTLLAVIFSLTLQASGYYFEDEALIDDIPFNTHKIVENYKYHQALNQKFYFADEPLVDDIPFDTQKIVENYKYHQALNRKFSFTDEPLVSDIPFDTKSIVMQLKEKKDGRSFTVAFTGKHLL